MSAHPAQDAQAPRYRLADHVRACRVDEQVILLDLKRNKYMGIGGPPLAALAGAVIDWPPGITEPPPSTSSAGLRQGLQLLHAQHMLTPAADGYPTKVLVAPAEASLTVDDLPASLVSEARHLPGLCVSAAVAAYWLKRCSLADIAAEVTRRRRAQLTLQRKNNGDRLRRAVATYLRLRPFVLTAHDHCLHDSLALIRFLALQELYPHWIIGVRTRPFGAHSWVQSGPTVLNDVHENVRAYTPIMVA